MDPQPACPAADVWRQILEGSLPDAAGDCSRHLDGCRRCQAVVEGLTGGGRTWLNIAAELRQPPPPLPPAGRQALELVRRRSARGFNPQPLPTRPNVTACIHVERMMHRSSIAVPGASAP